MSHDDFALPNPPFTRGGYTKKPRGSTEQKEIAGYGEAYDLQWRYGVQPNKSDLGETKLAQKIAMRVTEDGSQPPRMRQLIVLNPSVNDLADAIKMGSDWIVQACETISDDENHPFRDLAMDYYQRYDPRICGGYSSNRQASKKKNMGWFFDCMQSAAEVWAWKHPNPEKKDQELDFGAEYPYNIGLESGAESGFTTDAEESNANTPQRRDSTGLAMTSKLDSLCL